MKGRHRKSRYQVISFFQELILFFIKSFLYFPSHIIRIILYFVYVDDHRPIVVYPFLKEEDLSSSSIIDFDHFPLSKPCENDICIQISPKIHHPYSHVDYKVELPPANFVISCNYPIELGACWGKCMEHLTQSFSDISWLGQDSWECHSGFIASKHSLNLQVLITRIKASFMICICCNVKNKIYTKLQECIQLLQ